MDALTEFFFRSSIFMIVFLCLAYYLFKHIEKIKKIHGTPQETKNMLVILKHFFLPQKK
jgi:heme/copper-type cytochrome/quinol oxidase subunit 2